MPIAGFDPSITHFGWVILDENKTGKDVLLESGTFITKVTDGMLVQRLIMQRERVMKLLKKHDVKFVSMEAPYFMDYNTEKLFALNQFIHEAFLNSGTYVLYIPPQSLKKFACPDMDPEEVTKNHMIHAAKEILDMHGQKLTEHIADAFMAGIVGHKYYNWLFLKKFKDSDLNPHERESFCGKHTFAKGHRKGITEYSGMVYKENEAFFDYSKKKRKTKQILKEIQNGR